MNPVDTHCRTEKIWKGKIYRNIFEISIEIDEINQIEGRTLAIKNIKDRFRAVCKFCNARVTGSYRENGEIIVNVVIPHTCEQHGYYPSQLKKKQAIDDFVTRTTKSILKSAKINQYTFPRTTLYRMIQYAKGQTAEESEKAWRKLESFVNSFDKREFGNTIFEKDNNNNIIRFFIFPIESILYMKSNLFIGLIVIDGTFLKYSSAGTIISFATYTGNHKILSLCYGGCKSENKKDLVIFLEKIKSCIGEATKNVKTILSDEGAAIDAAVDQVFPDVTRRHCYLHKKANLHGKTKEIFKQSGKAHTKEQFNQIVNPYLEEKEKNEQKSLREMFEHYSPLYNPALTQNIRTNGASESLNSIMKREENDSIIRYLEILYDSTRTPLEQLTSECESNHTKFFNEITRKYIDNNKIKIGDIERRIDSNLVQVTEEIDHQKYTFFVVKHQDGRITCSCYQDQACGFGCAHIYYALGKYPDLGEFKDTIHPTYIEEFNQAFLNDLPERTITDNMYETETFGFGKRNMKKCPGKRKKCSIDYN